MAKTYRTADGDALDQICAREYGRESGVTEKVLEANPHLRAVAHRLPRGLDITLPDLGPATAPSPVRLWD